jgi:hypothetical protein
VSDAKPPRVGDGELVVVAVAVVVAVKLRLLGDNLRGPADADPVEVDEDADHTKRGGVVDIACDVTDGVDGDRYVGTVIAPPLLSSESGPTFAAPRNAIDDTAASSSTRPHWAA